MARRRKQTQARKDEANQRKAAPICIVCCVRPALHLVPRVSGKDGYIWNFANTSKLAIFCSETCAAAHCLLWFSVSDHTEDLLEAGHTAEELRQ